MKKINHGLEEHIRVAGYKVTVPRLAVLSTVEAADYPLTIQAIVKSLLRKGVNEVTVYRIVEAFTASGILRQSDLGEGRVYEYAAKPDHHHLVCTMCRRVWDFAGCGVDALAKKALEKTRAFAEVKTHSFELFGLCRACVKSS